MLLHVVKRGCAAWYLAEANLWQGNVDHTRGYLILCISSAAFFFLCIGPYAASWRMDRTRYSLATTHYFFVRLLRSHSAVVAGCD
jgi:hypothetical protein